MLNFSKISETIQTNTINARDNNVKYSKAGIINSQGSVAMLRRLRCDGMGSVVFTGHIIPALSEWVTECASERI